MYPYEEEVTFQFKDRTGIRVIATDEVYQGFKLKLYNSIPSH